MFFYHSADYSVYVSTCHRLFPHKTNLQAYPLSIKTSMPSGGAPQLDPDIGPCKSYRLLALNVICFLWIHLGHQGSHRDRKGLILPQPHWHILLVINIHYGWSFTRNKEINEPAGFDKINYVDMSLILTYASLNSLYNHSSPLDISNTFL